MQSRIPILINFVTWKSWDFPCCLLTRRQKLGPFISSFLLQFFCPILRAKPTKAGCLSRLSAHTHTQTHYSRVLPLITLICAGGPLEGVLFYLTSSSPRVWLLACVAGQHFEAGKKLKFCKCWKPANPPANRLTGLFFLCVCLCLCLFVKCVCGQGQSIRFSLKTRAD